MSSDQSFSGRVVLVTGASRGIGEAAAFAFAKAGAEVVAVARTLDALEALSERASQGGGTVIPFAVDMQDVESIERLASSLGERYGRLDVLIGSAGVLGSGSRLERIDPAVWDRTIAVNLTANWHLIRVMHPFLMRSDAGRALFITSGLAWRKQPLLGAYAASKAALNALVEAYVAENVDTALRVNLFSPGPTRTKLYAEAFPGADLESIPTPEEVAEKMLEACMPTTMHNGKVYEFRDACWKALQPPKPL